MLSCSRIKIELREFLDQGMPLDHLADYICRSDIQDSQNSFMVTMLLLIENNYNAIDIADFFCGFLERYSKKYLIKDKNNLTDNFFDLAVDCMLYKFGYTTGAGYFLGDFVKAVAGNIKLKIEQENSSKQNSNNNASVSKLSFLNENRNNEKIYPSKYPNQVWREKKRGITASGP